MDKNMTLPFKNVAVMMGGVSSEREISLKSGRAVAGGLRAAGYQVSELDVTAERPAVPSGVEAVFIALHGRYGEDGGVQAWLDELEMPYTGAGGGGSRQAFDKSISKRMMAAAGIPSAQFELLADFVDVPPMPLPVVVKPACEGSSIGIGKVYEAEQWAPALKAAFEHGPCVVVERCLEARELTVGIVGREPLPVIEIVPSEGYYDYNAKYLSGTTRYDCPAGIDDRLADECRRIALQVFDLLDCRGFGRVDFLLESDGSLNVLELNTIPGFTETSLLPKAARAAGIEFPELCDRIMRTAIFDRRSAEER
jgi:D-alanine-D-alanine ligase